MISQKLEDNLKGILVNETVSITTDIWSSYSKDSFLDISIQWIDELYNLQQVFLDFKLIRGPHTAVNIASILKEAIDNWKLNIIGIVTDNGANITAAVRELKIPNIRCAAHTIQLSVNHALQQSTIKPLLDRCRDCVSQFKHSVKMTERSKELDRLLNNHPTGRNVKQDVPTRWNSICNSNFKRISEN